MYSICVCDLVWGQPRSAHLLACDIGDIESAKTIVSKLARSYPVNGYDNTRDRFWFMDGDGMHLIWAQR